MRMMNVNTRAECGEMQFRNLYLNNPLSRSFRPRFNIISWHGNETAARVRVLARLTEAQVAANTTRGLTPGLVDPSKPNGARVGLPRPSQNQGRRPGRRTKRVDRPSEAEIIDLTADADGLEEPSLQSQPETNLAAGVGSFGLSTSYQSLPVLDLTSGAADFDPFEVENQTVPMLNVTSGAGGNGIESSLPIRSFTGATPGNVFDHLYLPDPFDPADFLRQAAFLPPLEDSRADGGGENEAENALIEDISFSRRFLEHHQVGGIGQEDDL